MKITSTSSGLSLHGGRGAVSLASGIVLSVTLLLAAPAGAADFSSDSGSFKGSWDTTFTYGQAWRIQDPDCNLIATADGGCGRSPNIDDGDLNFSTGSYSRAFKVLTELALNWEHFGAFVRASALYDDYIENSPTERTPLSSEAKDLVGSYVRLLDAFAWAKVDLGTKPLELRLGNQVVSWGESTFIQGGINTVNHFDVAALRVPGSELKEAFLPQTMAYFSLGITDNTTIEGFYLLHWDDTEPEPVGSYFSTNDFVPDGGTRVVLGFGAFSDQGVDFRPLGGQFIPDFQNVPRGPTIEPDSSGQFGLAIRTFFPDFINGTEIGVYFTKYHSRLPLISGRTGTQAGIANAGGAATAVAGAARALAAGLPLQAAIATAAQAGVNTAAAGGGNYSLADATAAATVGANTQLQGGSVATQANNFAVDQYARTAAYFTEFPEDIKLFGISFNTQFQRSGIALQGEVSYRQDVPLQYDDVEVLFAALTPLEQALFPASAPPGTPFPTSCTAPIFTLSRCGQLGAFGINQTFQGWDLHDVYQAQATATKTFANILAASQMVLVLEAGVTHVVDMPDKLTGGPNGRGLRFNGPGTSVSGNAELASRHFNEVEPQNRFADATSWGYRLAGRLEYPNLMGPWTILPRFSWQQDVDGTTPGPGGNFVEGRYGLTLGVSGNLRNTWDIDMSYSRFGGAGRYNDLNDRDFIAMSLKYAF